MYENLAVLNAAGAANQDPENADVVAPYFDTFDLDCYYFLHREL